MMNYFFMNGTKTLGLLIKPGFVFQDMSKSHATQTTGSLP